MKVQDSEGRDRRARFGDRTSRFLLLVACSLGFVCYIGGGMGLDEGCFGKETRTITGYLRFFGWLCGDAAIVLITWAVAVVAYRRSGSPLVLVLGIGFTVVFVPLGLLLLGELLIRLPC